MNAAANKQMMRDTFDRRALRKALQKGLLDERIYRKCRSLGMTDVDIMQHAGLYSGKFYDWKRRSGLHIEREGVKS